MALEDAKREIDRAVVAGPLPGIGYENAFAGATSFLRRRYVKDLAGVDLVFTGAPFDQAVTHRPGSRFGPRAVREASTLQAVDAPYGWGFNPIEDFAIGDHGDVAFDYADVAAFPAVLEAHVAAILAAGTGCIMIGGDHFCTLPALRAHAAVHGPLALIQFDAHTDTWVDDDLARIDHGTFVYKAIRAGIVDPAASVQVGIRTDNPDTLGVAIVPAAEVHRAGPEAAAARIRAVVGDRPAYITFDIDALDPAFAPGTGTPVWGGLASWQAAAILRAIAGVNMVGGDVVEVAPAYDSSGATAIAGAHVATELMCLWCWTRRRRGR